MESFVTKANGFQLLTIVAKLSILSAYWVVTASLLCLVQSHQNSPKYTNFFFIPEEYVKNYPEL